MEQEQQHLHISGERGRGLVEAKRSSLISEGEAKISQDKLDTEKVTSFVSIGGDSGRGVSIRFSDRSEPRKDGVASSPGSGGPASDCLQSQLAAVKLKLEQKRKKIEEDKRKVEVIMSKQREKVGQEAFLRAVAKGMERSPKEGGQADVEQERKPFILNEGGRGSKAGTPEVERNTLDLYQLQRGLQRQPEPFYISQPPQQPPATPPAQQVAAPYYMYPGHAPPPWYGLVPYHPPYYHPAPHMVPHTGPATPLHSDKPQPLTDKPSLSTSFLEMKRRQYQTESPTHQHRPPATSPRREAAPCHQQRSSAVSPRPASPSTPVKQSLSSR